MLDELLEDVTATLGTYTVRDGWRRLLGEEVARHAVPVDYLPQDRVLIIQVDSTAWLTQLKLLEPRLLRRLRESWGEEWVHTLRFLPVDPHRCPLTPIAEVPEPPARRRLLLLDPSPRAAAMDHAVDLDVEAATRRQDGRVQHEPEERFLAGAQHRAGAANSREREAQHLLRAILTARTRRSDHG